MDSSAYRQPGPPARRQFTSIQALRALAALAVLCTHLYLVEGKYLTGHWVPERVGAHGNMGVDLFFVISGFIMASISAQSLGGVRAAGSFLLRRLLRVYPMYWLFTFAALAVWLAKPEWVNRGSGHKVDLIASLTLWPRDIIPVLNQCWTLTFEMYFYCVFAALIAWAAARTLPALLALWSIGTVLLYVLIGQDTASPVVRVIASPLALEFIGGCAVALTAGKLTAAMGRAALIGGLVLLAASFWYTAGASWGELERGRVVYYGLPCALLVLGAVTLEAQGFAPAPRWLQRLGDASYSLYLSHILVLTASARLLAALMPQWAGSVLATALCAVAAVVFGCLTYALVEKPVTVILHRKVSAGPGEGTLCRDRRVR